MFEYKTISIPLSDLEAKGLNDQIATDQLNKLGAEDWRLVSAIVLCGCVRHYFIREIKNLSIEQMLAMEDEED